MQNDDDRYYEALRSRDSRLDGRFFVAVKTTGIYCRPICPAPTPKRVNVRFFSCAAAAEEAGFRACRRCRPETSPGTPAWQGTSAVVSRCLRLIRAGALDDGDVEALAERVGVGERQLRRLFAKHLGASPVAVARAQRLHAARALIDQTQIPIAEVAFAAGFGSVRQFNHAIRASFGEPPGALRRRARRSPATSPTRAEVQLCLPYRPPLDWQAMLRFFAARAIPGVECVEGDTYARVAELEGGAVLVEVTAMRARHALSLRVRPAECGGLLALVERTRRLFDLTADPLQVATTLGRCEIIRDLVHASPGLRVPGAWDTFEVAVRAVLGQQISVAAARTLAGRLVQTWGRRVDLAPGLTHAFPPAEALAQADLVSIGLTRARAATLKGLAAAIARGEVALDAPLGLEDAAARLRRLPGIGDWTAQYIAMRALGEPDAFPAGDLGLRQALGNGAGPVSPLECEKRGEAWRPWRAYAAMHLWNSLGGPGAKVEESRA